MPETFPTRGAAQAVLDEFLAEIAADIAAGDRAPDEGYDASEFIIVERDSDQPPSSGDRE